MTDAAALAVILASASTSIVAGSWLVAVLRNLSPV